MRTIRHGSPGELSAIRQLLQRANDMPYDLAVVAEEKCFGEGVPGPPRVRICEEDGRIRGIAVTCGGYLRILAVDRDHRRKGIGSELLEDSGAQVIAAEPGNYFVPGVLEPSFFLKRGYREKGVTWNMHVGIGERPSRPQSPSVALGDSSDRAGRAIAAGGAPALLEFVRKHFGAAWAFEAERAVIAHYIDGVGFAVAEANNRGLGTFGPAGVVPSARGHGYGRQLLLACLADLHSLGFERAIIPWTDAIDFYRKSCGAEPAHRFVRLEKPL